MDDFWHKGPRIEVPSEDLDRRDEPIIADVYLSQREQVDERGHYRHPMRVTLFGDDFTPENARLLAQTLARLADEATSAASSSRG